AQANRPARAYKSESRRMYPDGVRIQMKVRALFFSSVLVSLLTGCASRPSGQGGSPSAISVSPASATFQTGKTQQFKATATFKDGSTTDYTDKVSWKSSAPNIASIDKTGLATGV